MVARCGVTARDRGRGSSSGHLRCLPECFSRSAPGDIFLARPRVNWANLISRSWSEVVCSVRLRLRLMSRGSAGQRASLTWVSPRRSSLSLPHFLGS
jgi:hypothetical protein